MVCVFDKTHASILNSKGEEVARLERDCQRDRRKGRGGERIDTDCEQAAGERLQGVRDGAFIDESVLAVNAVVKLKLECACWPRRRRHLDLVDAEGDVLELLNGVFLFEQL